jgi:hypothetical protein
MAMDFVAVLQAIRRPRGKTLHTAGAAMNTEQQQQQRMQQQVFVPERCANSEALMDILLKLIYCLAYTSTA